MEEIKGFLESKPILAGIAGTVAGWSGPIAYWLDLVNKSFLTLGAIFGSIGAFFTMLIVIRKWLKDRE